MKKHDKAAVANTQQYGQNNEKHGTTKLIKII
jgi:hypothetical protein